MSLISPLSTVRLARPIPVDALFYDVPPKRKSEPPQLRLTLLLQTVLEQLLLHPSRLGLLLGSNSFFQVASIGLHLDDGLGTALCLIQNSLQLLVCSHNISHCVRLVFEVVQECWLRVDLGRLRAEDRSSITLEHLHFKLAVAAQGDIRLLWGAKLLFFLHLLWLLGPSVCFGLLGHVFSNEETTCLSCCCLCIIISLVLAFRLIIFVSNLGFFVRVVLRTICWFILHLWLVVEDCRVEFDR
jgi:hypothetical protein